MVAAKWIFLISICCCTERKQEPHIEKAPNDKANEKRAIYCGLSRPAYEQRRWVHNRCDALLFTSLRSVGCGDVDLSAFESPDEPGRWYRDPDRDCFVAGREVNGSDSTNSKDGFTGLMLHLWHTRDSAALSRTIKYGEDHNWVVCEAKGDVTLLSKCVLPPGMVSLLYDMREAMDVSGGQRNVADGDAIGSNTGFRAHLDVLHILLAGSVRGSVSSRQAETLRTQAERQPRNSVYQAAWHMYSDGDQAAARATIFDESHFPAASLPNNRDNHCEEYLFQRDDDPKDWAPCPDRTFEEFSGTDLAFAVAVMNGLPRKAKP